jgi:hypothetical protein
VRVHAEQYFAAAHQLFAFVDGVASCACRTSHASRWHLRRCRVPRYRAATLPPPNRPLRCRRAPARLPRCHREIGRDPGGVSCRSLRRARFRPSPCLLRESTDSHTTDKARVKSRPLISTGLLGRDVDELDDDGRGLALRSLWALDVEFDSVVAMSGRSAADSAPACRARRSRTGARRRTRERR